MKTIVNQCKSKLSKSQIFLGFAFLLIIILIAINPAKYSKVAFRGIEIWAKILLPSLLPFFILTKLFSASGVINGITKTFSPLMKKVYNCPSESSYVFFMSIITGYPVGSKLIADLYNQGTISKAEASRITAFCSNSGPMFILGSVAIGMFSGRRMGIVILISHILGALVNGIIYRNLYKNEQAIHKDTHSNYPQVKSEINFSESVTSSINSILLIGGVICFTFVVLEVITSSHIFTLLISLFEEIGLSKQLITAIFCGIGEITQGCLLLSQTPLTQTLTYCLCTLIISFGGISTFLQAYAFLKNIVPAKTFLLQKISHAIIACGICAIICLIL